MIKERIEISGMSCNHCIKSIEKAMDSLAVSKYRVEINLLDVEYDQSKTTKQQIIDAVEQEGYKVIN